VINPTLIIAIEPVQLQPLFWHGLAVSSLYSSQFTVVCTWVVRFWLLLFFFLFFFDLSCSYDGFALGLGFLYFEFGLRADYVVHDVAGFSFFSMFSAFSILQLLVDGGSDLYVTAASFAPILSILLLKMIGLISSLVVHYGSRHPSTHLICNRSPCP
jgi:hypothetical protein